MFRFVFQLPFSAHCAGTLDIIIDTPLLCVFIFEPARRRVLFRSFWNDFDGVPEHFVIIAIRAKYVRIVVMDY